MLGRRRQAVLPVDGWGGHGTLSCSIGDKACTGYATITGDDPLHLTFSDPGHFASSPLPYRGRYPCGSLVYDGVWYYGTYCLAPHENVPRDGIPYNWPWLGPSWAFAGRRPRQDLDGDAVHAGETAVRRARLTANRSRSAPPHFVDFGKDMEHSPDGKAYLVAHGGSSDGKNRRFAYNSWVTGDEIYLLRVTPDREHERRVQVRVLRRPRRRRPARSGRRISPRSSPSPRGATTWAA